MKRRAVVALVLVAVFDLCARAQQLGLTPKMRADIDAVFSDVAKRVPHTSRLFPPNIFTTPRRDVWAWLVLHVFPVLVSSQKYFFPQTPSNS